MDAAHPYGGRRPDDVLVRLDRDLGHRRRGGRPCRLLASGQSRPAHLVRPAPAGAGLRLCGDRASSRRILHAMMPDMRRHEHAGRWRSVAFAVLLFGGATAAQAGGQITFGDDTNTSANDGPPFFGFVRDASGSAVGDARVTATVKSGGALVTTSNSIGVYKIAGFAKSIN